MKRLQFVVTSCLAVVLGLCLVGCEEKAVSVQPVIRPVRTMTVQEVREKDARVFSGKTKAVRSAELSFRVPGEIQEFPVRVGQKLGTGELVAVLDPRDFRTRIASIKSQLAGAEAALKQAGLSYRRYGELYVAGSVAKSGLDQAEAAYKGAEARVQALGQQLRKAQDDLRDSRLKAPFAGFVTARHVDNFETVGAGRPIITLQDTSAIEVVVGIPDTLMAHRDSIESVTCTLAPFPEQSFPARIKELSLDADPGTRTFALTVVFSRPEGVDLAPGMAADVRLDFSDDTGAGVLVPETALFSADGENSMVWIVDEAGAVVRRRMVTAKKVQEGGVLITSGLAPGDVVVTAGANSLSEGQQVRLLETGPAHRGHK